MTKILVIPDTQVKEGVPLDHLEACGNFIVQKRPDYIVHLGDHWDMPSLSSYDRGKKAAEGRRVQIDIDAGIEGMEVLLKPLKDLQRKQRKNKKKVYDPEMHFLIGNHEERLMRHVESNPELEGLLDYSAFGLDTFGFDVHDFLNPLYIHGIAFSHYFYNPMSGRPYGGAINNKLNKIKGSFVQGHQQGLQIATETTNTGNKIWGIVAGSFYLHEEKYIGPQGNDHWRGLVMLHNVNEGDFSPSIVNMDYLLEKYL